MVAHEIAKRRLERRSELNGVYIAWLKPRLKQKFHLAVLFLAKDCKNPSFFLDENRLIPRCDLTTEGTFYDETLDSKEFIFSRFMSDDAAGLVKYPVGEFGQRDAGRPFAMSVAKCCKPR
jgi:hypothetical protein